MPSNAAVLYDLDCRLFQRGLVKSFTDGLLRANEVASLLIHLSNIQNIKVQTVGRQLRPYESGDSRTVPISVLHEVLNDWCGCHLQECDIVSLWTRLDNHLNAESSASASLSRPLDDGVTDAIVSHDAAGEVHAELVRRDEKIASLQKQLKRFAVCGPRCTVESSLLNFRHFISRQPCNLG